MDDKPFETYPRIIYNDGILLKLSRKEYLEASDVKPFIDTRNMYMDATDEVIKLSRAQALTMIEKLADAIGRLK
jgi:hypothetical protein